MNTEMKQILREVQGRLRSRDMAPDYENVRCPPLRAGGRQAGALRHYLNGQGDGNPDIYDRLPAMRSPVIRRTSSPRETRLSGWASAGERTEDRRPVGAGALGRQEAWWEERRRLGDGRATREGRPGEVRLGEGRPGEGRPGEGRPGDRRPADGRPGEGRQGEGRLGEGRPGEGRPGEGRPGDGHQASPFGLHIPRARVQLGARRKCRSMLLAPGSQEDAGILEIFRDPRTRSSENPLIRRPTDVCSSSAVTAGKERVSDGERSGGHFRVEQRERPRPWEYNFCSPLLPRVYLNMR